MEQKNEPVFLSIQEQDEIVKKYYYPLQEYFTRYMLTMFRDAGIFTIQFDDCLDSYNECFLTALRAYDP